MSAGLLVQRLVDAALYAAGAVPRGVAVAQQREACGNQLRRSSRSGSSSAVSVARAAGQQVLRGDLVATLAADGEPCVDIGDKRIDGFGEGKRIAGRNEPAAIAHDVPDALPVFGQDRAALRLRFKIDHAERLADAWPDEEVSVTELLGDPGLVESAQKRHPVRELRKQCLYLRPRRPVADDP